ncbi:MAG: hypothetical protein K9M57_09180, partial [Phycisphaerae bacterium]|nr:hypothetical protein [Phycisphaerae bacterium]
MSDINSTIGKINSTANTPSATLPVGFHPLHILVRRRWQLFSCLFLVACIALVSAFVYKPVYEAVAQVQVIPPVSETTSNSALAAIKSGGSSDYFKTQCELIQSQHILAQVADRMNLKGDYNGLVNELRDQVIIRPIAGSHLIDVVGMADNKSEAAAISNQLVTAFVDTSLAIQKTNDKRILEKILSQKDKFSKDVERYEKELHDFRQAHFTTDATKSLALVESRILQLENDHNQAQLACIALKARAEDISKSVEGNEGLIGTGLATEAISSDALCTQLKNSLQRLGQDEAKLSQAYLPGHRMLISVRSQISEVKDQLEQRKQKVFENTYANILHGYNEQVRQKETLGWLL